MKPLLLIIVLTFNMISTSLKKIVTRLSAVNSRLPTVDVLYKRAREAYKQYSDSGMRKKKEVKN